MGFTRFTSVEVAALLVLAWALVLLLRFYRPQRARVRVPWLALWEALETGRATPRLDWRAWRRSPSFSMLCALLLTGLLALALGDPRPAWLCGPERSVLVLIDAGRSMQALDVAPSRFVQAQRLAAELIRTRAPRTELMIAQLDAGVTPLSVLTRDERRLRAALERTRVSSRASDFSAAVRFGLEILRGRPHPELILISDGAAADAAGLRALGRAGIALHQLSVGRSARNAAISRFALTAQVWDTDRYEAMVEVENADRSAHALEVTLFEDGTPIDVRRLELAARTSVRQFYPLAASGQRLSAQVAFADDSPDDQPADDVAYAVLTQRPLRRVLLVTRGERYLQAALALDPRLRVQVIRPADYRSARGHDVAIFDGFAPSNPPEAPSLFIAGEPPAHFPFRIQGSVNRPFFDEVTRDHPLLHLISLRDVNLRKAQRAQLEPGDKLVARSRLAPLIVTGVRSGQPFVALTFDPRESDLPLRVAWPMLLARIIDQLSPAAAAVERPLLVGRVHELAAPSGTAGVHLRGPSGRVDELERTYGRVRLQPDQPGFYTLESAATSRLLAANLDFASSASIGPRQLAPSPPAPPEPGLRRLAAEPWLLLLAAALLVLCVDWLAHERRWTP